MYENPKILQQHRFGEPMIPVHPEATPGLVRVPDPPYLFNSSDEPTMPNIRSPQDKAYQPSIIQEMMLRCMRVYRASHLPLSNNPGRCASITYVGVLCANPCNAEDADAPVRGSTYPRPQASSLWLSLTSCICAVRYSPLCPASLYCSNVDTAASSTSWG